MSLEKDPKNALSLYQLLLAEAIGAAPPDWCNKLSIMPEEIYTL